VKLSNTSQIIFILPFENPNIRHSYNRNTLLQGYDSYDRRSPCGWIHNSLPCCKSTRESISVYYQYIFGRLHFLPYAILPSGLGIMFQISGILVASIKVHRQATRMIVQTARHQFYHVRSCCDSIGLASRERIFQK
jgi:hypothetical protein